MNPLSHFAYEEEIHVITVSSSRKALLGRMCRDALPALMLIMSGVMKLIKPAQLVEEFIRLGYQEHQVLVLGIVELACTAIYLVPSTSVLGAILLTGYLGGATATHVRLGENFVFPVIFGVLVWLGLLLREPGSGRSYHCVTSLRDRGDRIEGTVSSKLKRGRRVAIGQPRGPAGRDVGQDERSDQPAWW